MGQQLVILDVSSERDIEAAFPTFVQHGAGALFVGTGGFLNSERERIVALAARYALPASYSQREGVVAGGLMSYAAYVDKILKGAQASELPVEQPTKFELVVNLKAAKALELTIPPSVMLRADELIE